jgi:hypothetical protein
VRLLVPEIQRRGLFQREYAGPTLRDNLGLACRAPPIGTRRGGGLQNKTLGSLTPQPGTSRLSSGAYCWPP